jgi:Holliday junction resolvasome RuvABC endonuclease subunit
MTIRTLLAIDPGSREFGFAVFTGETLTDQNVKSLRRTHRSEDRLSVLQRTFTHLLEERQPQALAMEKNSFHGSAQNDLLMRIIGRMQTIARRHSLPIYEFAPNTIKKTIAGDPAATKRVIAKIICTQQPHLRVHLDHKHQWQERYCLNMFDAIATGLTCLHFASTKQLHLYAAPRQ